MSILALFYDSVANVKSRISSIFYDTDSKTLSTPNISIEPGESSVNELHFKELASNGSSYVGFKAADSLSANSVFILPTADGNNGDVLITNGSKQLSFTSAISLASSIDNFTSSGQTVFTASRSMTGKTVLAAHNGILKRVTDDFTISGSDLTFTYTIPSGHWVMIVIIG